jgi:hypothetical protein
MKTTILLLISVLLGAVTLQAQQVPQAVNYQTVVRDANGIALPNHAIGMRFTISDSTNPGTILYQETQTGTTTGLGLFMAAIGRGTVVTGNFSTINWGDGIGKYLEVELDANQTGTYQSMGSTQLLSVPFALYALNGNGAGPALTDTFFGSLNNASVTVTSAGTQMGTPTMTFTKQAGATNVDLFLYTLASSGTFTGGATWIKFYLEIDGNVTAYTTQQYIFASGQNQYITINATFMGLAAGTHTASVWASTATGTTSTGVYMDPGGWGGTLLVKERY